MSRDGRRPHRTSALGFICVRHSPVHSYRQIQTVVQQLPVNATTGRQVDQLGVFADAGIDEISETVAAADFSEQLHGSESPNSVVG